MGCGRNSGAEESPPVGDLGLSARPDRSLECIVATIEKDFPLTFKRKPGLLDWASPRGRSRTHFGMTARYGRSSVLLWWLLR